MNIWEALAELSRQAKLQARGQGAQQRYMPTLDEAAYRIGQLRAGAPVSAAGPGMSVPTATGEDYLSGSLDAVTPVPASLLTFEKARKAIPELSRLGHYLTDEEKTLFEQPQWRRMGQSVADIYRKLPGPAERAAVATAGGAKRGWYADSEQAIRNIFANQSAPDDPERFTALLAALSPQTSVQSNLKNALNTWSNWNRAGRPQDPDSILRIMGESVEGEKGIESVLGAWRNNAYRALTANDARDMLGPVGLSGPKVHSFFRNLMGISDEVTNDAWMSKLASIAQDVFGGITRSGKLSPYRDEFGNIGIKGPGYLAENIGQRRGAELLDWEPMEMQETGWSFGKTLLDLANTPEAVRKSMGEFNVPIPAAYENLTPTTAESVLRGGLLTDEAIAAVPAFGDLVRQQPYRGILESAGYNLNYPSPPRTALSSPYERIGVAPEDLSRTAAGKHVIRSARRLDATNRRTDALSRIDAAQAMQSMAKTPTEKKKAAAELGAARRQLRRSAAELPNIPIPKEYFQHIQR